MQPNSQAGKEWLQQAANQSLWNTDTVSRGQESNCASPCTMSLELSCVKTQGPATVRASAAPDTLRVSAWGWPTGEAHR